MVNEKIMFEVNVKLFETKDEAVGEEKKLGLTQKTVAEYMHEIITTVDLLGKTVAENNVCSVVIKVTKKELTPEWFVDKPYYNAFLGILKSLGIGYKASEGDERRGGYFEIQPTRVADIPSVESICLQIPIILKQLEAKRQEYLASIR